MIRSYEMSRKEEKPLHINFKKVDFFSPDYFRIKELFSESLHTLSLLIYIILTLKVLSLFS